MNSIKVDGEMTKPLMDGLATWVSQERGMPAFSRRDYQVTFLAVRADVIEAIAAGFALKTIWEFLRETDRIPFRYETFLKYVRRHITEAPAGIPSLPQQTPRMKGAEKANGTKVDSRENRNPPSVGGFIFNSNPRPEDLC